MGSLAHGKSSPDRLVIFGCGYVGAAVAEFALSQGVQVTALTRNHATASALRAGGIETVVADLNSDEWQERIPAAPGLVLNCVSGGGRGLDGYRSSYLEGMQSILRWCARSGPAATLVYTSSTSVYPQDGGVWVDEQARTLAPEQTQPGVLAATERQLMESRAACRRWFVLRVAGIYGPGRHALLEQVRSGAVSGAGRHHLNLAHRDDIVAAIWACFTAAEEVGSEIFNLADDHPTPKSEVAAWLAERIGIAGPTFTGVPAPGRRGIVPDRKISNAKIKQLLGWSPRFPSFREGFAPILAS